MKQTETLIATLLSLFVTLDAALADDSDWFGDGSWFASLKAGFVPAITGDGSLSGPTESVYGGSPTFDMDDGFHYAVAVGRDLTDGWRLALELSFLTSKTDPGVSLGTGLRLDDGFRLDADVDTTMLLISTGFDFEHLNWWANPYVRAGIGVAETEVEGSLSVAFNSDIWESTEFEGQEDIAQPFAKGSSVEAAWTLAAGFKKEVSDRFALRFEYSVLNRGGAWTGVNETDDAVRFSDLESQHIALGLEWRFH